MSQIAQIKLATVVSSVSDGEHADVSAIAALCPARGRLGTAIKAGQVGFLIAPSRRGKRSHLQATNCGGLRAVAVALAELL